MFKTICRYSSVGITTVGVGALLIAAYSSLGANPRQSTAPEILPAATFSFNQLFPWVAAPSPSTNSTGAATVSTVVTDAAAAANGALQTVNQLGPLTFDLDSLRSLSANQPPPGSTAGTANYTQMDQWLAGIAGLGSSTGALGFTDNGVSYDPYVGTHAGVLQTANQLGPMVFDLNVLKAIGFTQAPTGQVGVNGQPDNFSSVDIGRWTAGIPGVITNSGTTGFVTYQDFANGPFYDYRVGGLRTTTQVGSMAFDVNFLPFISTGVLLPPTLSIGLSPDMTAANTPFAPFSPPPPGVVQPMGGLPAPTAVAAPAPAPLAVLAETESVPAVENSVDETATPKTSQATQKPTTVIPGVNGAPLAKPRTTATSGAGGSTPFTPFTPFTPITDVITNGITNGFGALAGARPTAPGGTGSSGGPDSGGESSAGSESGGGAGS
jgi:hypothetical protein